MTANVIKLAYHGEVPWHGEGNALTAGASIETWIEQAGLGFEVKKAPVQYSPQLEFGPSRTFGDRFVTYRTDTGQALGLVSDRYKIVQPREVVEFYRGFEEVGMPLETAGVLGTNRVWGLAKLDKPIQLLGTDRIDPYFLFTTSFDGETSTIGNFIATRVVCCNTMQMAMNEIRDDHRAKRTTGFSVSHARDFNREWAQEQVHNLIEATEQYAARAELLAATGIGESEMLGYFAGLVGVVNKEDNKLTPQSRGKIDRLVQLYRSGPGADLASARGTAWGALNAVTRFVDFEAPTRKAGSRFASGQFGPGNQLKNRALEAALELAVAA